MALILRQLNRRVGVVNSNLESQVRMLSLAQLDSLGEALLDFVKASDLDSWLKLQR